MPPNAVSVLVSPNGAVSARSWHQGTGHDNDDFRVDLTGLDGRVLRVFDRWLLEHDRAWEREDIRVFGQLLHRRLFSPELWRYVRRQLDERKKSVLRLQLSFPADAASSRLAALPWEYLCAPDQGGDGQFLVLTPGLLLSRSVPPGAPVRPAPALTQVRVLPVVGRIHSFLGRVDHEDAIEAITAAGDRAGFTVLDAAVEVPEQKLVERVAAQRPDVVHYIGHGHFTPETGKGALLLWAEDGEPGWVDEDRLADGLCTEEWTPSVVVLHACEGGRNNYDYRHAGLAPALVRKGVHSVIGMQYPVTNETAITFTTALYDALADRQYLDEAVHTARRSIWQKSADARLLGVPMIYQRDAVPLLGGRPAQEHGSR